MSTELLYTSAAQGLRHGSRGFCTVLTTAGMPINVISKLEAISSYRHLYAPDSHQASENPVAFAHQRLNLGGHMTSVISRVSAYGTDYSGRTNKIAHHVTVAANEMPAAGPAWLIRQHSFLRSEWLGQCETPATGPEVPRGDQQPRICTTWKTIAGDSGWGGVVAESIVSGSREPLWVIYPLQYQDRLLELIDESISLLPRNMRWRATFSTYAANIPPDVDCKIRFVPVGSEESRFAASQGQAIDLTKHQSITAASQWVERARGIVGSDAKSTISTDSFNAVQDPLDDQPVASAWSSDDDKDKPVEPPLPSGPPSLPTNLITDRIRKKRRIIAGAVVGIIVGLGLTWTVARRMAGLPVFSLSSPQKAVPTPGPVAPQPTETSPLESPVQSLVTTSELRLHYDKKEILAWALQDPTEDTPLPIPISLRGNVRLTLLTSETDTGAADHQDDVIGNGSIESTAALVSWGGSAESLLPKKSLRITSTMLTDTAQSLALEQFPSTPKLIVGTSVYWSRTTGDLIAIAELDLSKDSGFLDQQTAAYKTYTVMISKVASRVSSIQAEREHLPESLQTAIESFLDTGLRGDKRAMLITMIRKPMVGPSLSEQAIQLSETLLAKVKQATKPLKKKQQDTVLRIVSDCERIARDSNELRRAYDLLQQGQTVEVPDLTFLDSEGVTLRRVLLRFHFSW